MSNQAKEIFEGFVNNLFPNDEIRELSRNRLKICFECPIRTNNKCDKSKGGCGCFLNLKTKSPDSHCPLKKW
jgi:hypothetical protein